MATLHRLRTAEVTYDNRIHSVSDRSMSVSQPCVRPIICGKAEKPVGSGANWISMWLTVELAGKLLFRGPKQGLTPREITERSCVRAGNNPSQQTNCTGTV